LWTLRGKRVAALGLAFKGDTDDIRDSAAIGIIKKLLEAGASVTAYDPAAMERAHELLPPSEKLRYAGGIFEAAQDADALLILTDWKEFADLDLERLKQTLRFPIVIDGRNLHQPQLHVHQHRPPGNLPTTRRRRSQAGRLVLFLKFSNP
jgi:UDPglucose 6-dehydrogenase